MPRISMQIMSEVPRRASSPASRLMSLLLALVVSGLIFTYPKALGHANHGLLMLVMLGVSAGFVHGVGFVPRHLLWRLVFSPWTAWTAMGVGLWLLLA